MYCACSPLNEVFLCERLSDLMVWSHGMVSSCSPDLAIVQSQALPYCCDSRVRPRRCEPRQSTGDLLPAHARKQHPQTPRKGTEYVIQVDVLSNLSDLSNCLHC